MIFQGEVLRTVDRFGVVWQWIQQVQWVISGEHDDRRPTGPMHRMDALEWVKKMSPPGRDNIVLTRVVVIRPYRTDGCDDDPLSLPERTLKILAEADALDKKFEYAAARTLRNSLNPDLPPEADRFDPWTS